MANELGCLSQGVGTCMPSGTDTFDFISYKDMPMNKRATYGRIVSEIRPQKPDPHKV